MADLQNGAMTIQRAVVLDGLRGLLLAQQRVERLLPDDDYARGYRKGFDTALMAVACLVGVSNEIKESR